MDQALHPGHHSIRFRGYDYSSEGLYFITICSHQKRCVFGRIVDTRAILSPEGLIVRECWVAIPSHFPGTRSHEFVIMPNHLHGIVEIGAKLGRSSAAPLRGTSPSVQPVRLAQSFARSRLQLRSERMNNLIAPGRFGSGIILSGLSAMATSFLTRRGTSTRIRRDGSGIGRILKGNRCLRSAPPLSSKYIRASVLGAQQCCAPT
jgi:REP element-mobilizing transposase RayT